MISSTRKDRRLLNKCIEGDKEACALFVRAFSGLIYHGVRNTLRAKNAAFNEDDVKDLHNTVFLSLFENQCRKLRQFKGKNGCRLGTWIHVITVRIVLNHLRRKGVDSITARPIRVALEDAPELSLADFGSLAGIEMTETRRSIREGIAKLPPRDRLFFLLHYEKGYSLKEVAEAMKLTLDNTYIVKHRAIQRLKHTLKKTV